MSKLAVTTTDQDAFHQLGCWSSQGHGRVETILFTEPWFKMTVQFESYTLIFDNKNFTFCRGDQGMMD